MNRSTEIASGADMSDWLWQVSQSQDKRAFRSLFQAIAPRVKSYFHKLGCNESEAEELTQQTMVQVWRKAQLYDRTKSAASTWIFRIARNLRIDNLRKTNRYSPAEMDFDLIPDTDMDQEALLNREEHDEIVRHAIAKLPSDQLDVIKLSFYEGLSHAEISDRLDVPLGTVKSRIRLAFSRLRKEVGETV